MKFINSDINTLSEQPEDSHLSEGEVAGSDQDSEKTAFEDATATSANPSSDVKRGRKKDLKRKRKPLPADPNKPTTGPGGASSGSSITNSQSHDGYLVWAPKTWRRDLKPMIRYMVQNPGGSSRIKYLTWDHSIGCKIRHGRPSGGLLMSEDYLVSEPLMLRGGEWNHATISFHEFFDDDRIDSDAEMEIVNEVSRYESIALPTLSEKAIWAEKPCVEWAGLQFKETRLRGAFEFGVHPRGGRLRVVTHEAFGDGEIQMVMKIWPTPTCSKLGLENEMMAYRACDGMGITPEFMGYVTEQGRHISMLTAYHSEAHKPRNSEEKELCRTALHTFQIMTGWQRNPKANHRDNYLVEDGRALLIDLASVYPPDKVAKNGGDWAQKLLDEDFDEYWTWT